MMRSQLVWTRQQRASTVLCKAKGFGGATATKQQPGRTKKGAKRVAQEEQRKQRDVTDGESAVATVQREALNSLHHHLAAGVMPAHINGPDPATSRWFDEQNESRLRSSLAGSAVASGILDIEQREHQQEQDFEQELDGSQTAAGAAAVIDVEFAPADDMRPAGGASQGNGTSAAAAAAPAADTRPAAGASQANGTAAAAAAAAASRSAAGEDACTGTATVADNGNTAAAAAQTSGAGTEGTVLLSEEELASRIARLWDDVPDELRELMASTQEPGLGEVITEGAPGQGLPAGAREGWQEAPASSSATGTAASVTAGLPDLDALLAPLEPKVAQTEVASQGPVTSSAERDPVHDANEIETIDYSKIAEQFTDADAAEMEALLAAAATAAQAEEAPELIEDDEDGEGSIGSVRVMALQQEVASANKKVELLQQQLLDSEEHARLLAQEVKLLQLQQSAGTYGSEQPTAEQQGQQQHQQLLSELEMQVAQIANELLMVSLSMKNIDTAERRQLRGIVNQLLALKFNSTDHS